MFVANATVHTERPSRYIKQLVSHMGRKVGGEVRADGVGVFTMVSGAVVTLTPVGAELRMRVETPDPEVIEGAKESVARHLLRFATQEELTVRWTDGE